NGKEHHRDLENFCADGDGALAVTVGEVAASHREENEGEGEERTDDEDFGFAFVGGKVVADDEEDDEVLEGVVVERTLKLRGDEAPESQTPGARSFSHANGTSRRMMGRENRGKKDTRRELRG